MMSGSEWVFDGQGHLYDLAGEFTVETYGSPEPIRWISIDDLGHVFGRPSRSAPDAGSSSTTTPQVRSTNRTAGAT